MALLRFLFSSATLGLLALVQRAPRPQKRNFPILAGLGILGITIYHLCLNWGQQTVTAGAAGLLIASTPMITAILARFLLGERLSRWAWAGILIGFGGITLIALGEGEAMRIEPGALLVFFAAVSTSLYSVLQKKHIARYPPLAFTTYVVWAGTLPFLVFIPELFQRSQGRTTSGASCGGLFGRVSRGLAYVLWVYGLSRTSASRLSSFLYLNPVLAILIAWIWLGEMPSWLTLVGGAIALTGVALANLRPKARIPKPN